MIILNRGKIVAVDTTENLTSRMQKSSRGIMEVDGPVEEVRQSLQEVPGVLGVEQLEQVSDQNFRYQIDSEKDQDVRRQLAATTAAHNWGQLELRVAKLALIDVFVQTRVTEEKTANAA